MLSIGVEQRRARMVARHHLDGSAPDCVAAAAAMVGLHSSDPVSVFISARARCRSMVPSDLERALYEDRSLVRILGMRRTMFVVPADLAPVLHAACTRALAVGERKRLLAMLEGAGITSDPARWLSRVERDTLAALAQRGEATASELSSDVPALRRKIPVGTGKRWGGTIGVSTRVLFLLATDGKIVRARPRGSWTSTQYRWVPAESWLGVDLDGLETEPARAELVRRWLAVFGPGTFEDLKWWTGWTVAATRRALAGVGAREVDLGGSTGFVLPGDVEHVEVPAPGGALLPALDPSVMGWSRREWFLGDHRERLFDRNGNAGPTVWWRGRIVGGWTQRPTGEIVVRLLEDPGAEARAGIEAEAASLQEWLGGVRFVPRFRTPLEAELASGPEAAAP